MMVKNVKLEELSSEEIRKYIDKVIDQLSLHYLRESTISITKCKYTSYKVFYQIHLTIKYKHLIKQMILDNSYTTRSLMDVLEHTEKELDDALHEEERKTMNEKRYGDFTSEELIKMIKQVSSLHCYKHIFNSNISLKDRPNNHISIIFENFTNDKTRFMYTIDRDELYMFNTFKRMLELIEYRIQNLILTKEKETKAMNEKKYRDFTPEELRDLILIKGRYLHYIFESEVYINQNIVRFEHPSLKTAVMFTFNFGEIFNEDRFAERLAHANRTIENTILHDELRKMRQLLYKKEHNSKIIIENVIYSGPATIILWSDGTKTVVKCGKDDKYDKEKGFAMALCKKFFGNDSKYYNVFKRWVPEDKKKSEDTIETMSVQDYGKKHNLSNKAVYKMIDEGAIKAFKNNRGHWRILCEK